MEEPFSYATIGPEQNWLILNRKIVYSGITIRDYDYLVTWWNWNIVITDDGEGEDWKECFRKK